MSLRSGGGRRWVRSCVESVKEKLATGEGKTVRLANGWKVECAVALASAGSLAQSQSRTKAKSGSGKPSEQPPCCTGVEVAACRKTRDR
jgi:hypothetical protein